MFNFQKETHQWGTVNASITAIEIFQVNTILSYHLHSLYDALEKKGVRVFNQ